MFLRQVLHHKETPLVTEIMKIANKSLAFQNGNLNGTHSISNIKHFFDKTEKRSILLVPKIFQTGHGKVFSIAFELLYQTTDRLLFCRKIVGRQS